MKNKLLIFAIFFYSIRAYALIIPCPANMMGPENRLLVNLKTGKPGARIEGPATLSFDECWVELTEDAIIPTLRFRVKTDAKFKFKKKILFVKIKKTIPLRCSFKSTVHTKILDGCEVRDTKFSFYRLKCRGIPRVFTKIVESLIKKEIRKKGGKIIQELLRNLADKDEIFQGICSNT